MIKHLIIAAIFFSSLTSQSFAEEEINTNPLTAKIFSAKKNLSPGEQTEITVTMQLAETYHAYLDKFKFQSSDSKNQKVNVSSFEITPVTKFKDTFSGKMKDGVQGLATLKSTIEIPENFSSGKQKLNFKLTYQACTEKHCLFPKKIPLSLDVVINISSTLSTANNSTAIKPFSFKSIFKGELSFSDALAQGTFFTFLFIFLAGFLTSLTPCVYPMIPITLAVIGAKSTDKSSRKNNFQMKSFILSLFYVLGIAITFSSLGVVAALTGALFGSALSNPIVVSVLAIIFVVLGLSMYGLFEIQAPAFLRNKASSQKTTGYLGAIFAGLVSGIVAGPCIGPVLIGVLTHVGEKQDVFYGFSLLFTYSLGMGLLFIALGTFSGLINKVPKASGWMDGVKFIFGTTMIAMALYYIEPLANIRLFYALLAITLILISSFYGAFTPNTKLNSIKKLQKGIMLATFLIGVFFMLKSIFGKEFLATSISSNNNQQKEQMNWQVYSDEKLAEAKMANIPVIIDFSAEWCVACKELEHITFVDAKVISASKVFTLLRFDATESTDKLSELKEKYKVLGLPTILFFDKNGDIRKDLTLTGFEEAPSFLQRMEKAL